MTIQGDAGTIDNDIKIGKNQKPMNSGGSSIPDADVVRNKDEEHESKQRWAAMRERTAMNMSNHKRDVAAEEERKEREE